MTPRILGVFVLPSEHESDWRRALQSTALASDWDYRDFWGIDDPPLTPGRNSVVVVLDTEAVVSIELTEWIVLSASPQEVMARSKAQFELDDHAALLHAASRLSAASTLVSSGALLRHADAATIDFPGLGSIRRPTRSTRVAMSDVPLDAVTALQIFQAIPPGPGTVAVWPASLFSRYGDPSPGNAEDTIDLTGKGRILVHGPYLGVPAGRWRITFEFEYDTDAGSAPFRFDWGEVADIVHYDVRAFSPGRYSITLEKEWLHPGRAEVRIWLYHAVFQGEFKLNQCTVEYLGPPRGSLPTNS